LKIVLFGSPIKNQKKNVSKTIKKKERDRPGHTQPRFKEKKMLKVYSGLTLPGHKSTHA
jgi:hypothetical protein